MQWIKSKILNIKKWDDFFFSIFLEKKNYSFIAGQFTKLALKIKNKFYFRFYSFISSSKDKNLEFFLKKEKRGYLSNLLFHLSINDYIYISKYSYGNFIIKNTYKKDMLFMICIGTSISPLLSILKSNVNEIKKKFKKIFFLYGVKYFKNIYYLDQLFFLKNNYGNDYLNLFFSISKEKKNNLIKNLNIINGHINDLFFYFKINKFINFNNSHFMICGNNNMINNITYSLKKNFHLNEKNFTLEKY